MELHLFREGSSLWRAIVVLPTLFLVEMCGVFISTLSCCNMSLHCSDETNLEDTI